MEEKFNNSNVIKNISFNQKEILYNIMQMHNNGKSFEADMTASTLGFYKNKKSDKYVIPEPKILLDVFPQRDDIIKIEEYKPLPLEDNSIESMVCDLPFIVSPKQCASIVNKNEGSNIIFNRFHSFYPASDMLAQYKFWIEEIYRVLKPNGICVFKTQSTISGGHNYHTSEWSWLCAVNCGFYVIDKFILEAKARLIGNIKTQKHARRYTSDFWVFKKDEKKSNKVNYVKLLKKLNND
jgi:hypothetical protein